MRLKIPEEFLQEKEAEERCYGTSGFRDRAETLKPVVFRVGLAAALRSSSLTSAWVGVMITASHNPQEDNGVKVIDPSGEMLEGSWEPTVTKLVNVNDEELSLLVDSLLGKDTPRVLVAMDTRLSSPSLMQALKAGIDVVSGNVMDLGYLTTPQLHYAVRVFNQVGETSEIEQRYYTSLSEAFNKLTPSDSKLPSFVSYKNMVHIDCANGVGGAKLSLLAKHLNGLHVDTFNFSSDHLNEECGADYVKFHQKMPKVHNGSLPSERGKRIASLDGDADRIVYYFLDSDGVFRLLDGDYIAVLIADYLQGLLSELGLLSEVAFGFVQTAYANGNSSRFVENSLNVPVKFVPTGVKHLHSAAKQFDIGVYFEANGHGTVLFSEKLLAKLNAIVGGGDSNAESAKKLLAFSALLNQTTGDAMSDLLAVEAILAAKDWDCAQWSQMYIPLPNRQLKVKVPDRSAVKTTDAERRVETPKALQDEIDGLISHYKSARCFVRPSGTEDIVRIYAEAETQKEADELAAKVESAVTKICGTK